MQRFANSRYSHRDGWAYDVRWKGDKTRAVLLHAGMPWPMVRCKITNRCRE
jgi:hypothetical protein